MARLASGAKLGYYPTPESVCRHIRMLLDIEDGVKALDPCCGDGTALELITAGAEVIRYGIELDQERYQKASEKLDHVLHGDALKEVEISGRFDLLFLNPPYDWAEGRRLEEAFLEKYSRYVAAGGWIIHIVPAQTAFSYSESYYYRFLLRFSTELYVLRFPDGEYEHFKQVVIFQRYGRASSEQQGTNGMLLRRLNSCFHHGFSTGNEKIRQELKGTDEVESREDVHGYIRVEAKGRQIRKFVSTHISDEEYREAGSRLAVSEWLKHFEVPSVINCKPLAPLRNGHLAMLVASGIVNGMKIDLPDGFMVIKGAVRRDEVVTVDSEDELVSVDRPQVAVRVLFVRGDSYSLTTLV